MYNRLATADPTIALSMSHSRAADSMLKSSVRVSASVSGTGNKELGLCTLVSRCTLLPP